MATEGGEEEQMTSARDLDLLTLSEMRVKGKGG